MSSDASLANYANRVLCVDQETSSFVPIVGLNKAPDMAILDAVMVAWRDCAKLHASVDEDDMEVLQSRHLPSPPLFLPLPPWAPICIHRISHVAGHRNWRAHALHELVRGRPLRLERGPGGVNTRVHAGDALLPSAERAPQGGGS